MYVECEHVLYLTDVSSNGATSVELPDLKVKYQKVPLNYHTELQTVLYVATIVYNWNRYSQ